MGRKPLPNNLKVLKGTAQKCRTRGCPEPEPGRPEPPDHLEGEALKEWHRIVPELEAVGLLTLADRAALAAYCQVFARWCDAEAKLKNTGLIIKTSTGNVIQSPMVGICNKALEMMLKYLVQFGMTPSSRSSIKVDPGNKKPAANPFQRLAK